MIFQRAASSGERSNIIERYGAEMIFNPKNKIIEFENCLVLEALPNSLYKVKLPNGHIIMAHEKDSGRLGPKFITILPGDIVTVEVSPYDSSRGRIIWRKK